MADLGATGTKDVVGQFGSQSDAPVGGSGVQVVGESYFGYGDSGPNGVVPLPGFAGVWRFASQRDNAVGNPTPPSQVMRRAGIIKGLLIPVAVGARTVSIDVKFEVGNSPYPRLIVRADPRLGLWGDAVATAAEPNGLSAWASGTTYALNDQVTYRDHVYKSLVGSNIGNAPETSPTWWKFSNDADNFKSGGWSWQTLTASFTIAVAGVVEVWREKQNRGLSDAVWWDNIRAT